MRLNFPKFPAFILGHVLDRTLLSIYRRARTLKLAKVPGYFSQWHTPLWCHWEHPNQVANRFKKGIVPANKGTRRPGYAPGRMAETMFKRGRPACESRNYVPIGTEKICPKRGCLMRKMTDDPKLFPVNRWSPVHRLVWEAANGPVPAGHFVRFRTGMKVFDAASITLDRLELVTHRTNLQRNSLYRYPKEIVRAIHMRGALNRAINRRTKETSSV